MKIRRLVLMDFGKFHQKEVILSPGLNILTGKNESGKTTLCRFVRSMFYGLERERGIRARKDDYTRYKPWEYGRYQGMLEFEAEGELYRLFRNFLTTEKEIRLTKLSTGKEIEQPVQFMQQQGLLSEAVFTNTFWVGNACVTEDLLAEELKDYLANLAYTGGAGLNLQKSLVWLAARKKELLRQVPEKELNVCMELQLQKDSLQEQVGRMHHNLSAFLRRQKELEGAVKVKRGMVEQLTVERRRLEKEEGVKFRGERVLYTLCTLAVLIFILSFTATFWQLKAIGWIFSAVALSLGFALGIPMMRKGKLAGEEKEALCGQLAALGDQQQALYEELTKITPEMEQERLRLEQVEEQLKSCENSSQRYTELLQQKKELLREAEAVSLAAETLTTLSGELYEEFGTKFAKALSEYTTAFTDHAYEILVADEDLNLKAVTEKRNVALSEVSFGTGEQFYLALRFAAADVFDPEKKNPVVLDDSFAAFDEERLESAMLALARSGRQVLVLSSTGREEAVAKRMGLGYEAIF